MVASRVAHQYNLAASSDIGDRMIAISRYNDPRGGYRPSVESCPKLLKGHTVRLHGTVHQMESPFP